MSATADEATALGKRGEIAWAEIISARDAVRELHTELGGRETRLALDKITGAIMWLSEALLIAHQARIAEKK